MHECEMRAFQHRRIVSPSDLRFTRERIECTMVALIAMCWDVMRKAGRRRAPGITLMKCENFFVFHQIDLAIARPLRSLSCLYVDNGPRRPIYQTLAGHLAVSAEIGVK